MTKSEPIVRGFKINTILDRLALDMLRLLDTSLKASAFDRDRFHLGILMTLSRGSYLTNLLYRDFRADTAALWHRYRLPGGKTTKIHEQSTVYLQYVLARRLRIARRLLGEPGNMHLLLGQLCKHASLQQWDEVLVKRELERDANNGNDLLFAKLSKALERQRKALGHGFSDDAKRRDEYGPIWLILMDLAAELPEEMSLFDVVEAAPVPLKSEFCGDLDVQRLLVRVLDSLNERYMLLRSIGLDPEEWHDREDPAIGRLRDLKRLRQKAEELLRLTIEEQKVSAYRRAFEELQGNDKAYAGFRDFDDFATSEVGLAMLRYPVLSLDDPIGGDDEGDDWLRSETLSDPDAEDAEEMVTRQKTAGRWVELLINDRPKWFDPVMRTFFEEVIGGGRPIHAAPGEPGLLGDKAFRALVDADPELSQLDDGDLAEELYQRAEKLIKRGVRRRSAADA
jgi:hypothetical protein